MTHDPGKYLTDAYLGEIGGEASFHALANRFPERAADLTLLADVEARTASYLADYLADIPDSDKIAHVQQMAHERMQSLAIDTWDDMVEATLQIVTKALEHMRAQEQHAPADLLAVYQTYTAHEQALADYLYNEKRGQPSTAPLETYLASIPAYPAHT